MEVFDDIRTNLSSNSSNVTMAGDRPITYSDTATYRSGNLTFAKVQLLPEPPMYLLVILTIMYALILLLGVIGNILVPLVIIRSRSLKNSVNIGMVNLCLADLLVLLVCMPTAWVDIYAKDVWYFGPVICKLVPFLENCVTCASIFTIVHICINRHSAICWPIQNHHAAVMKEVKIMSGLWLLSALISCPFILITVYRDSKWVDKTPIKVCKVSFVYPWQRVYVILLTAVEFFLPFLIILVLHTRVTKVLRRTISNPLLSNHERAIRSTQRRRQSGSILVMIVFFFFLFHAPYRLTALCMALMSINIRHLTFEEYLNLVYFVRIILYINHAVNPIIYNLVSKKFRAQMVMCFKSCCDRETETHIDSSSHRSRRYRGWSKNPLNVSLVNVRSRSQSSDSYSGPHKPSSREGSHYLAHGKLPPANGREPCYTVQEPSTNKHTKCYRQARL